jgi:hypothetical protein
VAEAAQNSPATTPKLAEAVAAPAPLPRAQAAVAETPAVPKAEPKAVIADATETAPVPVAIVAAAASEMHSAIEAMISNKPSAAARRPKKAHVASRRPVGPGDSVVQLGSYRSPQQVTAGWDRLTQRYPSLRGYLPLRARFDSPRGTYWRLSIQGFANQREAINRCAELKSNGGKCFVRGFAGDAPVQIASN